jgi:cyclophilin family peptidyl-prolyl cis-trans isomerase
MIRHSLLLFLLIGLVFWSSGRAGTLALFRLPIGEIEVELFDQEKPVTVQNFILYIQSGRYLDSFAHRWEPGFVIQGGGFFVTDRFTTNAAIAAIETFGTITNEYNTGRIFSNAYGTIAMARVGKQTNSATSQWFFNLADNPDLDTVDGGFTVFGRVVGGTNILNRFNNTSRTNGIYRTDAGGALNHLPVLSATPGLSDLVFTDINLLSVEIRQAPQDQREILWNSVSNKVNVVEFTDSLPAIWKTLISTNGDGSTLRVRDASKDAAARYYRVRVEF